MKQLNKEEVDIIYNALKTVKRFEMPVLCIDNGFILSSDVGKTIFLYTPIINRELFSSSIATKRTKELLGLLEAFKDNKTFEIFYDSNEENNSINQLYLSTKNAKMEFRCTNPDFIYKGREVPKPGSLKGVEFDIDFSLEKLVEDKSIFTKVSKIFASDAKISLYNDDKGLHLKFSSSSPERKYDTFKYEICKTGEYNNRRDVKFAFKYSVVHFADLISSNVDIKLNSDKGFVWGKYNDFDIFLNSSMNT
jgi:hypothetical protein